jgi:hypothetical protein
VQGYCIGVKHGLSLWGRNTRVFENSVEDGHLELKGRKMDHGENCIMMNFITCILHQILLG